MHALLFTLKLSTSRRPTELALLVGAIGSVGVALGAAGRLARGAQALGALLVAVAFVLLIVAVHWGVSPFRR